MNNREIKLGPNDIVLPVIGPIGTGKSTFINAARGENVTPVGHSTTSCTKQPLPIIVDPIPKRPELNGRRLVLLDTPGFDDTHEADIEILKRIAKWLEDAKKKGALVGGVLYFHDISVKRFNGTASQNLRIFSHLCGDAMAKTALVTTNWPPGRNDVFDQREKELKDEHWKDLTDQGLQVRRFQKDSPSAWDVINALLDDLKGLDLQLETAMEGSPTRSSRIKNWKGFSKLRKIFVFVY